jgi:hypothetical protein
MPNSPKVEPSHGASPERAQIKRVGIGVIKVMLAAIGVVAAAVFLYATFKGVLKR